VFRGIALALPFFLLAGVEWALRLAGVGYPSGFFLKAEFPAADAVTLAGAADSSAHSTGPAPQRPHAVKPVWIENQRFGWRFFPRQMARTPEPLVLPVEKGATVCRIFVLGESAAMGDPEPAFGFSRVLEVLLREEYPGVDFEVANTAMTAINSHAIREIARECARRRGDLWIVYMGNNEVVGPYGAGTVFTRQAPGLALARASIALKATRLGQLVSAFGQGGSRALEWEGMEMFLRQQVRAGDPGMSAVYRNFEKNLEGILDYGRASGARVVLSTVVANLKDCPPFASTHRPGLPEASRAEWERLWEAGQSRAAEGKPAEALAQFAAAARLDGDHAELQYRIAQCRLALGQAAEAREAFRRALDLDTLRFRVDSRLNEIVTKTARARNDVAFVDAAGVFAQHSPDGLAGDELLLEHVHLNFDGNVLLGRTMLEAMRPLLPERVRAARREKPPLSSAEIARRLAFTDWNRLNLAEEVRKRLRQPPFTHQADHDKRDRRWSATVAGLKEAVSPAGLQQALAMARAAVTNAPGDWRLRTNLAGLLEAAGDFNGAIAEWREVRRLLPHGADAPYRLANLAGQGRGVDVEAYFREALRLRPDAVEVLNGLGLVLAADGRTAEAIAQFEKALALKPRFVEARANLGQTLAAAGRVAEAREQYETALRQDTNCLAAHVNLGKLCAAQGAREEAVAHYREALRINPDFAVAHFNLGNALAALQRWTEAAGHYEAAVRAAPDWPEARQNFGIELARQGRHAEALDQFAQAVKLKPDWPEARVNLGVALARAQRFDEAVAQFGEALRLDPGNAAAAKYLDEAKRRRR